MYYVIFLRAPWGFCYYGRSLADCISWVERFSSFERVCIMFEPPAYML